MQENINFKSIIKITDRKKTEIDGVDGILAFDDRFIKLDMEGCALIIEGEELRIENMIKDTKKILITGFILGLYYDKKSGKGKKLYK